jgi:hypothetical protein
MMLGIAGFVIAMAFALDVVSPDRVAFRLAPEHPLPHVCMSRSLLGVSCPGCGLTRSFILLAEGDWSGACGMNRVGWLFFLAVVAQIPYRLAALALPNRQPLGILFPRVFGASLLVLLVANWIVGLVEHPPNPFG